MWFLSVAAFAVPPDKQVALLSVGTAQIERFTLSPDGRFLAGRDAREADEGAWVLDLETWSSVTLDAALGECRVAGVAVRPIAGDLDTTTDDYAELWVACNDGTLRLKEWEDGVVYDVLTDDGTADFTVTLAGGLAGLWYSDVTDSLYGVSFADERAVHMYAPADATVDSAAGFPVQLNAGEGYGALVEGNIVTTASGVPQLLLAHGQARVSAITLEGGGLSVGLLEGGVDVIDATPSLNGLYAIDSTGDQVAEYFQASGSWNQLFQLDISDIAPQAIVANLVPNDEWMVVFGDRVRVWEMANGIVTDATPYWESPELGNFVHDGLAYESYVYGGGEGGGLRIITARPWVDPTTVAMSPTAVKNGDEVAVTFMVDEDADWTLHLNGDRFDPGVEIANGDAAGGVENTVTFTAKAADPWIEGTNSVYIVATAPGGLTGHAVASIVMDNPPTTPSIPADALDFEDGLLQISFPGIPDDDLAQYLIYVSETEFAAADFADGGGPEGKIEGGNYPLEVAGTPGAQVTQEISPLVNDTKYWVAVRAVDAGGKESGMSVVLMNVPRPGQSGADLAGEPGGGPCSTGSGAPSLALALAALVALRRRARAGALLGAALLAPGVARAVDDGPEPFWKQHDLGSQYGTFELRYESLTLEDPDLNSIYDDESFGGLNVQFGPSWKGIVELDFGMGLLQKKTNSEAYSITGGEPVDSLESLLFTAVPLNVDLGGRLKLLDEQILVPHAKVGIDYFPWKETRREGELNTVIGIPEVPATTTGDTEVVEASGEKTKTTGWNLGAHYAIGGALLLDVFAPARASLLEAQTGVNDTYLLVEWRRQVIDNRKVPWESGAENGFTFTGSSVNVGIKLDF